jgi:hypothetical protein
MADKTKTKTKTVRADGPAPTPSVLSSPDAFAAEGLSRLWTVLESFAEAGWDYRVVTYARTLFIELEANEGQDDFPGIWRIVRAMDDEKHDTVLISVHDGGGGGGSREWVITVRVV